MGTPAPLDGTEEELWRVLATVLHTLPRVLEVELQRNAHISSREYAALANLAEHRDRGLRVNQLATLVGLSASRVSRLVDALAARGEIKRQQGEDDARSQRLEITEKGLARLEAAWPHQVASVRRHVMDHVDPASFAVLTKALKAIAEEPGEAAEGADSDSGDRHGSGEARPARRAPSSRARPSGAHPGGDLRPLFLQQE